MLSKEKYQPSNKNKAKIRPNSPIIAPTVILNISQNRPL